MNLLKTMQSPFVELHVIFVEDMMMPADSGFQTKPMKKRRPQAQKKLRPLPDELLLLPESLNQ